MPEWSVWQAWQVLGSPLHRGTLLALLAASLAPGAATADEYAIDPERTTVEFQLLSLGSLQRGHLTGAAGTVSLDAVAGTGRIDIVIDAQSAVSDNASIESVLRSPAMLDVRHYPHIAYRAQRMTFVAGEPVLIDGELTLRDVTHIVPLEVTRYACTTTQPQRCSMIASATIRRSDFGMQQYQWLASDEVLLSIRAEGVRVGPGHRPRG
jgi:polyisoprenoid-binding protein YceI